MFVENAIDSELLGRHKEQGKNFAKRYSPNKKITNKENLEDYEMIQTSKIKRMKTGSTTSKIIVKLTSMKWLEWKGASCRYDSLLTVLLLGLYDMSVFKTQLSDDINVLKYNDSIQILKEIKQMVIKENFHNISEYFWKYMISKNLDKDSLGTYGNPAEILNILNEFNALVLDPTISEDLKIEGWCFHDSLQNAGNIVKLKKNNILNKYNPYILFFLKE